MPSEYSFRWVTTMLIRKPLFQGEMPGWRGGPVHTADEAASPETAVFHVAWPSRRRACASVQCACYDLQHKHCRLNLHWTYTHSSNGQFLGRRGFNSLSLIFFCHVFENIIGKQVTRCSKQNFYRLNALRCGNVTFRTAIAVYYTTIILLDWW